jgi:predicted nucleic acid-binding protein
MAISGRYTAVLDACVLFSRLQRDVLLSLAHADLYTARWTQEIEREWASSLVEKYPDATEKIPLLVEHMRETIPDCLIDDYAPLIASIQLPDESDRHVLAAAIRGNADAIVSLNTKDFPAAVLATFDIEIQTPDQFVLNQIMLNPPKALTAIKKMRERWERPSMLAADMVDLFEKRQLPQTAAHLRDVLDLI